MTLPSATVKQLALDCGFELAGIAAADPLPEAAFFLEWARQGMAGEMTYLTGERAALRLDPKTVLPTTRSIICVGKFYNGPHPHSSALSGPKLAWISRYAWGHDYHRVLRRGLKALARKLETALGAAFDWRVCVDTAPLLERAYARRAGLGWIARNTCLVNQRLGSWFFLGELVTSLELAPDAPPADRCGSCTRCIDACPTQALVPAQHPGGPAWMLDSRLCISCLTIENRGPIPVGLRAAVGRHVFGCDICQEVCPWNRKAPADCDPVFSPLHFAPPLEKLAPLSEQEFRALFRRTAVPRARYNGFLRNVAVAIGNSRLLRFRPVLNKLSASPAPVVAEHARWALRQLR